MRAESSGPRRARAGGLRPSGLTATQLRPGALGAVRFVLAGVEALSGGGRRRDEAAGCAARWMALAAIPALAVAPVVPLSAAVAQGAAGLLVLGLAFRLFTGRRRGGRAEDAGLLALAVLIALAHGRGAPDPEAVPRDLPELVLRGRCSETELGLLAEDLSLAWEGKWRPIAGSFLLIGAPRCEGAFLARGEMTGLDDPPPLGLADPWRPARAAAIRGRIEARAFWLLPDARGRVDPGWRARTRAFLRERMSGALSEAQLALVAKILWNEEGAIDPETTRVFRATGTVHLLAISGLHVSFFAFLLEFLLRLFLRRAGVRLAVTFLALFAYAAFVGPLASVVRSTLMAVCLLFARSLGRRGSGEGSFWLALVVMASISPGSLHAAGSRLSFAATAALMVRPRLGRRLDPVSASLAATTATAGILWGHFGETAPIAIAANLIGVPVFAPVFVSLVWGLLWGAPGSPVLDGIAWGPARLLLSVWIESLECFAPMGEATIVRFSCGETVGIALSVGSLLLFAIPRAGSDRLAGARRRSLPAHAETPGAGGRSRAMIVSALAVLVVAAGGWLPGRLRGMVRDDLAVAVLSVGQGDAILLRTPHGSFLVDAGPGGKDRDRGRRLLAPALRHLGVERLRGLFLTHGDEDHVGGVRGLLRAGVRVDTLYVSRGDETRLSLPGRLVPPLRVLAAPWRLEVGRMRLELLAPRLARQESRGNEGSLVLRARAPGGSLLLPGDIGEGGERGLLAEGIEPLADVLMAAHHGSRTSSCEAFVDRVRPRLVLISCGARNRHGHPAPETLARFARRNVAVHRTDREGSLFLRWRHGRLEFRPCGCRAYAPVL